MEKSYRYLGYFLVLFVPLIFTAFYKTYLIKFPNFEVNFDNSIHIHAFIASVWVLILIVQPFLILYKKMAWHRMVGKLSYVVFPLLILSFIPGILKIIESGVYKNVFFPVGDCLLLIILYSLAIYLKKSPPKHMRYMIASSLVLMGPTLGRIGPRFFGFGDVGTQTMQYAVIFSILAGLIISDVKSGKNYTPCLIGVYGFAIHAVKFYLLFYRSVFFNVSLKRIVFCFIR